MHPLSVNQRNDACKCRRCRGRPVNKRQSPAQAYEVACTIGANIWEAAGFLRCVVLRRRVGWAIFGEVSFEGGGLVFGHGENVGETAAGGDDCFAGDFGG